MGRWIFKGFGCLLLICFGVVGGYLLGSSKAKTHDCAPSQPAEELHPLDRELDAAQDGLGPSSRTAGIYYDFLERWDAELNRVYREWMRKLEPEEQKTLRDAQRAWIVSRDADQKLIHLTYWPKGRSITPTMYQSFAAYRIMNLTRERVLLLNKLRRARVQVSMEYELE